MLNKSAGGNFCARDCVCADGRRDTAGKVYGYRLFASQTYFGGGAENPNAARAGVACEELLSRLEPDPVTIS
jgi:hypothetical protein